ncbi:FMN-binding glutamate synthase family protein [Endozoicomonas sp. 8E]|uniref:FMN-binding glutamate synthase family protein n=1 Tax=Endozoicomonas sp. 8E TaxID=3035692 RepID=UPI0029393842|nr:FMN-binding glutamate synthase family protein [Endozoicomonas sp. 8E]WOG26670.1 FMN-binding glutamate synthase family protein [Endozoicomonas sp. 8E]
MARKLFFWIAIGGTLITLLLSFFWPGILWLFVFLVPYTLVGVLDLTCTNHNVLKNYPVIGHMRYALEFISPEIHQYFIESNQSGKPFNREIRNMVYSRAKGVSDTQPFGTQFELTDCGYHRANHSLTPKEVDASHGRILIGEHSCSQPYLASRLNISGMSFGALSANAIRAMNAGARRGGFAHNTGEGGLSRHHLAEGGDLVWQIGTGYFGCRTQEGGFDEKSFAEKVKHETVKMVEVKLSQGAKPSHGGVLPAVKVSKEIAEARGVPEGVTVISPPAHSAFSTPKELILFIDHLRGIANKPVGFKLCLGNKVEFMGICKAILETGLAPDFITVDGAEGGTGAAPVEYTDRLGMPLNEALVFAHNCLTGAGLREKVKVIASGKVASGFDMVTKIALGADLCNSARAMMFAVGCIQALKCNTNHCPTGVTTQDPVRGRAVNIAEKQIRVANYHRVTVASFLDIVGAMGLDSPEQLSARHIFRRLADQTEASYATIYPVLETGCLLNRDDTVGYSNHWAQASAGEFLPGQGGIA